MLFVVLIVFGLLPTLYGQLTEMVRQIPSMLTRGQAALTALPVKYPELFSVEQVEELIGGLRSQLTALGQAVVASSLSGAASIITLLIYLILMPILIFFFLRDKERILDWFIERLPRDSQLAMRVWGDVDLQIGNYIRGKFWEILIVWLATFLCFAYFGLQFSMLLAVLVGLSVLIPYVGAAVVTIPVILIAWFQWGWSSDFIYVVTAYLIIQALDGNHPTATARRRTHETRLHRAVAHRRPVGGRLAGAGRRALPTVQPKRARRLGRLAGHASGGMGQARLRRVQSPPRHPRV